MSLLGRLFRPSTRSETATYFDDWSAQYRTNAFCDGSAAWFHETRLQDLNPDFPSLGPLFRDICARMPDRWWFHSITHACGELHDAAFGCSEGGTFYLCGSAFDDGIRICLPHTRKATQKQVADFLMDLNDVLTSTGGLSRVRWFSAEAFVDGCAVASDLADSGSSTPLIESNP